MSSILNALEKLDYAVGKLDHSVSQSENNSSAQTQICDADGNVIDVDFVTRRLDRAIQSVENLLSEGE